MDKEEEMKKIIVFSHALEIGGAERALLGLLHSFDYEKYQVDLFLMRHQGELMKYIPSQVHVLPEIQEYTCLAVPISQVLKKKEIGVLSGRIKGKVQAARFVKRQNMPADNGVALEYSHKYTYKYMPMISEDEYDLALSFLTPHYFVAKKVKAKKKIAWIHTDYSYIEVDEKSEFEMWNAYDYIASISDECTEGFCGKFPELEKRIIRVDNIISTEFVRTQADAFNVLQEMPEDGFIRILSVGRFCNAKNFDNVPIICRNISRAGLKVKWYLIGFGPDESLIRERIKMYGMEKQVIILGKKENPYPYIKACDVYIQPSRYEGNSVCVHEAQILEKPVIITNYPTAKSQLQDGIDGMIVSSDNENCAKEIIKILQNEDLLQKLIKVCRENEYSNNDEVRKIYAVLKGNEHNDN